jgi:pyruvate dehydrogenase E1 component alpha subunit
MNLAALWQLPVLFCCENNLYAMGTAPSRSESETTLAYKAAAYEMPAWTVDGMDVLAVEDAARRAATEIRGGGGPVFLELRTFRFRAHSMYDPERYRTKEEVDEWRARDPIVVLTAQLAAASLLEDGDVESIEAGVAQEIDEAIAFAEAGTFEPVEELTRFVYSERPA